MWGFKKSSIIVAFLTAMFMSIPTNAAAATPCNERTAGGFTDLNLGGGSDSNTIFVRGYVNARFGRPAGFSEPPCRAYMQGRITTRIIRWNGQRAHFTRRFNGVEFLNGYRNTGNPFRIRYAQEVYRSWRCAAFTVHFTWYFEDDRFADSIYSRGRYYC